MYTDDNGIVRFEATDNVAPLQVGLNAALESVSDALDSSTRIWPVANASERDALVSKYPPTAAKPLYIHRTDKGYVEVNMGSGWGPLPSMAAAGRIYGGNAVQIPSNTVIQYVFGSGYNTTVSGGVTGNNRELTAPVTGWYTLFAGMRWGGGTTGTRQTRIVVDGDTVASEIQVPTSTSVIGASVVALLDEGSKMWMEVYHSQGGNLPSNPGIGMPMISMAYVGAQS